MHGLSGFDKRLLNATTPKRTNFRSGLQKKLDSYSRRDKFILKAGSTRSFREKTMIRIIKSAILASVVISGATSAALADPSGTWLRDNGASRVRVAACGASMCGTIVWLKDADGPSKVGQRVFYDMAPAGANKWSGKAFNPEDGKTYSGTMTLAGSSLTTSGCVLGGLVCRSVNWRKMN
jgi:uncharacterized protein (DUF2147 family)